MRRSISDISRIYLPIWVVLPMVALALVLGVGGGYLAALRFTTPCPLARDACASLTNLWKTWEIASEHYVDPSAVVPEKMTEGAIQGMLDSLGDQGHTRYFSPRAAQAQREAIAGRFEGIGAYVDVRDDQPLIVEPIEGSPAEQAGLRPGDLILKVDGVDVRGMTADEVAARVRGPRGTSVTLTIQHEGEGTPIDVTVTREEINVPSVSWRMLQNDVALIDLDQFAQRSADELQQALTEAKAQGARAIVLDLRNNPGGLVHVLIGVASQFLPPDTVVLLEQDRAGNRKPYKTEGEGVAADIPLVVLVNNFTGSAAEILAGALKDHGRAKVIGVPTVGTATVLLPFDLENGAMVYIGVRQWLTPKGEIVRGKGIQPDEVVALPAGVAPLSPRDAAALDEQALFKSQDAQLVRALELLRETASQ